MASGTISFNTNGALTGRITWSSTSNGSVANTSTVTANIQVRRTDSYTTTGTFSYSLNVGGSTTSSTYYGSISSNWVTLNTITKTVNHKADGTGTCYIGGSITGPSGTSLAGKTVSGGSTVTLDKIARYFTKTPTLALTSRTEHSMTVTWSTSEICDRVDYTFDGTTVTSAWTGSATSGTFTFSELEAGSSHTIRIWCRRKDSQLGTSSTDYTFETYDYPKASVLNDFLIGSPVTIEFYNPLNREFTAQLIKQGTNDILGEYQGSELVVTGFNSAENIEAQYESIPNSSTGTYYVKVTYNENVRNSQTATFSVNGTETPTFSASDWSYSTSNLSSLTHDSLTIIKGYSDVTFTVNNGATAKNYASITGYNFASGNKNITVNNSQSVTGTLEKIESEILELSAIDSRGLFTKTTKTISEPYKVNYVFPSITNAQAVRQGGISNIVYLNLEGTLYNGTFGPEGESNTIYAIKYRVYDDTNETWSNWYNASLSGVSVIDDRFTVTNTPIHENGISGGFTIGERFKIEAYVSDGLGLLGSAQMQANISDGKVARDVYQDYQGEYHEGVNGLADEDYTQKVYGDLNVAGEIYKNGIALPEMKSEQTESEYDGYNCNFLNDYLDSVDALGEMFGFTLTNITSSMAINGWRTMASDFTTPEMPAGKYIMEVSFGVSSSQAGIGLLTVRPVIDGAEVSPFARLTIPTGSALMSGVITVPINFSTATTHTLNAQLYALSYNVSGGTAYLQYRFIKIK